MPPSSLVIIFIGVLHVTGTVLLSFPDKIIRNGLQKAWDCALQ
jgi:hypothetical protein